jgi:hypothetical protein
MAHSPSYAMGTGPFSGVKRPGHGVDHPLPSRAEVKERVQPHRSAGKFLARPTSRCILFDGENILFDANLVIYTNINRTNIPPIMIINRIYEHQNILSL